MFGGLAERFKAAVLKTVEVKASAGSNPVSSANREQSEPARLDCSFLLLSNKISLSISGCSYSLSCLYLSSFVLK